MITPQRRGPRPDVSRHRRWPRLAVVALLASVLAGCASILGGESGPTTIYSPDPRPVLDPALPTVSWQLALGSTSGARTVDSYRIAVRPTPGEIQVYRGASWARTTSVVPNTRNTSISKACTPARRGASTPANTARADWPPCRTSDSARATATSCCASDGASPWCCALRWLPGLRVESFIHMGHRCSRKCLASIAINLIANYEAVHAHTVKNTKTRNSSDGITGFIQWQRACAAAMSSGKPVLQLISSRVCSKVAW